MKISFVIPAYNEEEYLGDCIESIFKEAEGKSYNLEVIVVNNASTDKTRKVATSYKNVKVIDEPKKGLVFARKKGCFASSGDLIANIDADTRLTPGWIDRVLSEFSNPKIVALSGPFIYYDLSEKMKLMVKLFYYYAFSLYLLSTHIFNTGSMLQGGNFVLRKSAFEKSGGYDTKHYSFYGEDAYIAKQMHSQGIVRWTFRFPIYSSGRRIAAEGPFTMMVRYTMNYCWVLLFGKPFTKDVVNFRFKKKRKLFIRPKDIRQEWISGAFTIATLIILPIVLIILLIYSLYVLQIYIRFYASK
ncbi:MAG TPA: glycosyltransferase family 2 protein [Patescibacteria group bacterium]|nr:glycosyltransferase family 2 protein [Patescibacteria group bacterium]